MLTRLIMFNNLPDFYVLGVMRGGTSSMFQLLGLHPQIYPPHHKEINFFCDPKYKKGVKWYSQWFPQTKLLEVTFDCSPFYFCHADETISRIEALTPNARLIVLLRDPVARAWSEYCMYRETGYEDGKKADFDPSGRLMQRGLYYQHLKKWVKTFSRERFFITESEFFFERPRPVFWEIQRFLRIENFNPSTIPKWDPLQWRKERFGYPEIDQDTKDMLLEYYEYDTKLLRYEFKVGESWEVKDD